MAPAMLSANPDDIPRPTRASDIWMLGQVVYELLTGQPYWPPRSKDTQVLQILASPNRPLPHEDSPVAEPVRVCSRRSALVSVTTRDFVQDFRGNYHFLNYAIMPFLGCR